jgi:hypothetical protein
VITRAFQTECKRACKEISVMQQLPALDHAMRPMATQIETEVL